MTPEPPENIASFEIPGPPFSSTLPAKAVEFWGSVNAEEFEGHAPGTVMFMGIGGDTTTMRSAFNFWVKPSGWNNAWDERKGRHEPVFVTATGQTRYRSVNFPAMLESLSTS